MPTDEDTRDAPAPTLSSGEFMRRAEELASRVTDARNRQQLKIQKLEGELRAANERAEESDRTIRLKNREIEQLKATLTTTEARFESSQRERQELVEEGHRKDAAIRRGESEISQLRSDLSTTREAREGIEEDHRNVLARFENLFQALNSSVDDDEGRLLVASAATHQQVPAQEVVPIPESRVVPMIVAEKPRVVAAVPDTDEPDEGVQLMEDFDEELRASLDSLENMTFPSEEAGARDRSSVERAASPFPDLMARKAAV